MVVLRSTQPTPPASGHAVTDDSSAATSAGELAAFDDPRDAPSVLETRFEHPKRLALALAESIAEDLRRAVQRRGRASLIVSGGSTPLLLFEALSAQDVPWDKVWVSLADERWVDPDDDASNEKLVRTKLLVSSAASAHFVPMKNDAATPEEGEASCEAALAELPRPFDVVVLGMGEDGHTASLFPGAAGLEEALDLASERLCAAVRPPEASHPRMTLTLAALLYSRRTVVHITGEAKWQVYRQALAPGPAHDPPIRAVLGRGPEPIDVYWAPS